jgi:benzylsuccinate CoA-transferase BbsE subunit
MRNDIHAAAFSGSGTTANAQTPRTETTPAATPSALAGIRVLDLTGSSIQYCGKLFADLGADVTLVEPPGGSPARRRGPFLDDKAHLETSLSFAYHNAGKKSVVLDLTTDEARGLFLDMVREADLVIESSKPGTMRILGLDYESLKVVNPAIVLTSITPFGQTGPFADYASEDIVTMALGGLLYLGGYPDGPPMAAWGEQANLAAAQFGAVASMMALLKAETHNLGCHVDVSTQEAVVLALENAVQYFDLEGTVRKRHAGMQRQAGMGVFPCLDGQVYFMAGGVASNKFWTGSVQWLLDEGAPGAAQLLDPCWLDAGFLATPEAKRIFASVFEPFSKTRTKAQLYAEGQARRLPICPVSTPADLLKNQQLAWRAYFVPMHHTWSGRTLLVPGAPYRMSATPWRQAGACPRIGEHTAQVLAQVGVGAMAGAALLHEGAIQ